MGQPKLRTSQKWFRADHYMPWHPVVSFEAFGPDQFRPPAGVMIPMSDLRGGRLAGQLNTGSAPCGPGGPIDPPRSAGGMILLVS